MRRTLAAIFMLLCALQFAACGSVADLQLTERSVIPEETSLEETSMKLFIGETEVPVTWEKNESVTALQKLAGCDGLTVSMSMYGGFEQVGSIGQSLPRSDRQTKTSSGDIVLYSGDQIVIFYGSNSWEYTRLGHVELSRDKMRELLGNGDVTIRVLEG